MNFTANDNGATLIRADSISNYPLSYLDDPK